MKQPDWTSLKTILIAALVVRVIAAIFSQGYGMHDDHFLVIEAAASWSDGYDYNHWLPWSTGSTGQPEGHSFTYVGINYIYFVIAKFFGIADPKLLMLFNRLLHGIFSLLIVYLSYRITEKISTKKAAQTIGWILALLWLLPYLSVRNLVEITCIPFILGSVWLAIKYDSKKYLLAAGMLMGMAVSFRYQVGVFAVGMAAVYFFKKEWKYFFNYSGGVLIVFIITQGIVDMLIWGYPFAEFIAYFTYNSNEGTAYIPNNNIAIYMLVLGGIFGLPLGVILILGFFKSYKKYVLIFVPVLLFILFHSFYPSKQERFIMPVFPLFLVLGVVGVLPLLEKLSWKKWWNASLKIFWILNIPILIAATFAYTKKSRVEAMYYFYETSQKPRKLLLEASGETDVSMLPKFYCGKWRYGVLEHKKDTPLLTVFPGYEYDFIVFFGEENLKNRVDEYRTIYPKMELGKVCEPGFVDLFLRWLNPRNSNEYIEVWKTNEIAR